jgi:hypothetical protein
MDEVLAMALDVLPAPPWDARAIRADGGPIGLRLLAERDGRLHCTLDSVDADTGLELTIPVESRERGGFSVVCVVEAAVPLGASRLAAELRVSGVARRKPFRASAREDARAAVVLWAVEAANHGIGTELTGRVIDVSSGGMAFVVDRPLQPGDRLRVETIYGGVGIQGEVLVLDVDRGEAGGWRAASRFTDLPAETREQLDARRPGRAA